MSDQPQGFNPKQHLIHLKGKIYLETRWRIAWFREDHPNGRIQTEIVSFEPVVVKATICDAAGMVLATAHAGAVDKGNAVWSGRSIEKSETAAIGRALGHAGYGTQFTEDGEDSIHEPVDSPGQNRQPQRPASSPPALEKTVPGTVVGRAKEDLRDKDNATAFIQHWRKQGLADAEVLDALGVAKLSAWVRGREAADRAVEEWKQPRLAQESA